MTINRSATTAMVFSPEVCEGLTTIWTFCCTPKWLPIDSVFDKTLHEVREAIIMLTLSPLLKHLAVMHLWMSSRTGPSQSALNFTCDSQQAQMTPSTKSHTSMTEINEWMQMTSKQLCRGFLDECAIYYLSRTRWICSPASTHNMVEIELSTVSEEWKPT